MPIMLTNFARKHEYDVNLWRHKQRTPNTNDHHLPLNETPHENFLRTPLKSNNFKYIWTRNGTTYLRRNENSNTIVITKESDLVRYKIINH